VALEQPGPWGRKALTQSHLDPVVGAALEDRCAQFGGRALLFRAVGDHEVLGAPHRLYLAGRGAGAPWLLTGLLGDPAGLPDRLPWSALAAGDLPAVRAALPELEPCPTPILLVCTNAKRDACCAVRGRPVAAYAAGQRPGQVWECTHLGGHRFAPTAVTLPLGASYGRLDGPAAVAALDAAGRGLLSPAALDPTVTTLRGLAHLSPAGQAADAYARVLWQEPMAGALRVIPLDIHSDEVTAAADGLAEVDPVDSHWVATHADGRQAELVVRVETSPTDLAQSCGGAPEPVRIWRVAEADSRS